MSETGLDWRNVVDWIAGQDIALVAIRRFD
jgi:hypothetical protein